MALVKRKNDEVQIVPVSKKAKTDVVAKRKSGTIQSVSYRVSNLNAPTMLLEGHESDVYAVEFHPEGEYLISAGFDRKIFVWSVFGEGENISIMSGHSGAILEMHFTPEGDKVYTASTDQTLGLWDFITGQRIKKYKGHSNYVNCVQGSTRQPLTLVSGADDNTIRIWDVRKRYAVTTLQNNYQVTAVAFSSVGDQVFSAGIDNDIKVWDLRKNEIQYVLNGHLDTVTGLRLSPDGSYLLSNSMDNTLRIWDVRPYTTQERCVKFLTGHQHNFEKNLLRCAWSPNGMRISAGSSDRFLNIWDTTTRNIVFKLPGHKGSINGVDFHPREKIIASCSSDKTIYIGEVDF